MTTVISNAYIAPIVGDEISSGYLVIEGTKITAVGSGSAPVLAGAENIDASGCLVTPGLVNTHHHLYQWASQGLAKDNTLFEWLVALYKPWSKMDAEVVGGAAAAGLGWLAKSGCTTSTDHHYIFPKGRGDLFAAEIDAAQRIGVRFQPCRGSMDRGVSDGGLPPDEVVETLDDSSPLPPRPSTPITTPPSALCSASPSRRAPRSRSASSCSSSPPGLLAPKVFGCILTWPRPWTRKSTASLR
jgi:cytosine/adenosine deaminase-related metal-dependent hydrolase